MVFFLGQSATVVLLIGWDRELVIVWSCSKLSERTVPF
jgi:hypothetical protein